MVLRLRLHGRFCRRPLTALVRCVYHQNAFAVYFAEEILSTGLRLKGSDIVVLAPFRANAEKLQDALTTHPNLASRGVQATTPDAFQASESKVIVLVFCTTEASGPLIAAEAHWLCVAVTRHVGALFLPSRLG